MPDFCNVKDHLNRGFGGLGNPWHRKPTVYAIVDTLIAQANGFLCYKKTTPQEANNLCPSADCSERELLGDDKSIIRFRGAVDEADGLHFTLYRLPLGLEPLLFGV